MDLRALEAPSGTSESGELCGDSARNAALRPPARRLRPEARVCRHADAWDRGGGRFR